MAKISKRYKASVEKVPAEAVGLAEAVKVLKQFDAPKFDQTVEIHMRLGVDAKQADQLVRGSIVLPHGIGKSQRVVVFAKGPAAEAAKEAGFCDEIIPIKQKKAEASRRTTAAAHRRIAAEMKHRRAISRK